VNILPSLPKSGANWSTESKHVLITVTYGNLDYQINENLTPTMKTFTGQVY